jgi:hypothetical protein
MELTTFRVSSICWSKAATIWSLSVWVFQKLRLSWSFHALASFFSSSIVIGAVLTSLWGRKHCSNIQNCRSDSRSRLLFSSSMLLSNAAEQALLWSFSIFIVTSPLLVRFLSLWFSPTAGDAQLAKPNWRGPTGEAKKKVKSWLKKEKETREAILTRFVWRPECGWPSWVLGSGSDSLE